MIKPDKLAPGNTIGIISPAGAVRENKCWQAAEEYFRNKGYKVKIAGHAKDKRAYLAGDDNSRLADLIDFFKDDEVNAILCSRGGYGIIRLLADIDYEVIRNNPKIFVGYSDVTSLLVNFIDKSNLVTFHGPLALSDFGVDEVNKYTESSFFDILEGKVPIPHSYANPCEYECINPGQAEGVFIGGNLAILCSLLGTPYFPDLTGKILLLEDIGEPLYKIDRMLMQLKLAGVFEKVSGILFGGFTAVNESDNPDIKKLQPKDIIRELTNGINIPIGYGFPAFHGEYKATLPMGVKYFFDTKDFQLTIIEDFLRIN